MYTRSVKAESGCPPRTTLSPNPAEHIEYSTQAGPELTDGCWLSMVVLELPRVRKPKGRVVSPAPNMPGGFRVLQ